MNIHEYNKTFYYGLSSLFFLGIISLLTYLFKFKNIQNFINLFILFIILLLAIYCSSIFKNNIIEDFTDSVGSIDNDTNNTKTLDIAVPVADEPFGRSSGFDFNNENNGAISCFTNLYDLGFRGFHFYVEYPLNSDVPYCVFPYKDSAGMNTISTRSIKYTFSSVVNKFRAAFIDNDSRNFDLVYLCVTCLSPKQENQMGKIIEKLEGITNYRKQHEDASFSNVFGTKKIYVTLGTYDNIPLVSNNFSTHYFIKENDLKYSAFNVVTRFGLYAPLLNYTKTQQDTFNARGYDDDIQQSVNLAYINGVQFVCIPPTKNEGTTLPTINSPSYDYDTTVEACKTYFTDINSGNIIPYKKRQSSFLSSFNDLNSNFRSNSREIQAIKNSYTTLDDFNDLSLNHYTLANDVYDN
tara:strand:+ start:1207 stop:2433 length:1227 start_codon:yes stop_codon:yes gene_type:complete